MTILIYLICILLALAIFAGAFYMAKFILRVTMRNELLETNYKLAEEHIAKLEERISYLDHEVQQMQYEAQLNGERIERPRAWNASDPLNSTTERQ
jgi:uncharacterized membrane protein YciS (DUF1049 family)